MEFIKKMKFIIECILFYVVLGCESEKAISPTAVDIKWYSMPYDIPEENAFGGKSWKNIELNDSKKGIIWPYSVIFDTDELYPYIKLFYHKGRCCLWFNSGAPWVKDSCLMYSATKDVVWISLKYRVITNDLGQKIDWADVDEISEEEFFEHSQECIPGTRFLELRGPQVIIGSCGCLRRYVLKDIDQTVHYSYGLKQYLQSNQ